MNPEESGWTLRTMQLQKAGFQIDALNIGGVVKHWRRSERDR